jgi:2,4-dienoyl-CoA reductase-like NADH-dependent reductase (Old Yellow Enzyme family)
MQQLTEVFSEFYRPPLRLRNRIVRSATAERFCTNSGIVDNDAVTMYRALAEGGVGLIITGHMYIRKDGKAGARQTGIWSHTHIDGLQEVCNTVHSVEGAKIMAQISHAGRQTSPDITGREVIAPSSVPVRFSDVIPREMTQTEIEELITAFADAALRAQQAGFDGVQLHAAHGYMISQFLSPFTNHRDDRWGGNADNRRRFLFEIVKRIRDLTGGGFPILVKINGEDMVTGGLMVEETIETVGQLAKIGLWGYEISGGIAESTTKIIRKRVAPGNEGYFLETARRFRVLDPGAVRIVVGGLRSLPVLDGVIASGEGDLASMSRPFIREPNLVNRWMMGDTSPSGCISCNLCLKDRTGSIRCHDFD